ncbi:MAG TPA: bifunctional phosphoribosylaminoimidazolecarboxamide formyltransferase/IMP cyclohydrolase [Dehalococcoidia bacterium]|nr:bifunctional phosphoribosylaminoimidazolecarboxamide formyltransferase/IMP cyclohydrolase [Dehalococcoidia bacterium]
MTLRAILAPYDKTGLVELARGLEALGVELYATGNTQRILREQGVAVRPVSDLTGFPEILGGRVKTLHPGVHGGILARRDKPEHLAELEQHGLAAIDLVVGGLYPFEETVAREGVTLEEALENIDIGGPTMLRAAAKNFPHVLPIVDPTDYNDVLDALRNESTPLDWRRKLAVKAFQHVATYDTAIAAYLRGGEDAFPDEITLAYRKRADLRYGENPHQRAALYRQVDPNARVPEGVVNARQLNGKALSYVNILDADAAWSAACDFAEPTAVIVKHMTPCGIASRDDLAEAFRLAFEGDPISAFGGIIAINRPVDRELAAAIRATRHPTSGQRLFVEIIVAPAYGDGAVELLAKSKDLRILEAPLVRMGERAMERRGIVGGILMQEFDRIADDPSEIHVRSRRQPTDAELADMRFAWRCVKHVKSNAVVVVRDRVMVGMGAGQPNRVTSARLAVQAAGERARGAVSASDALIPFPDTVEVCAEAGVTAVIQTGGSIRDEDSVAVCDAHDMAMVATGVRHFKH